MSAQGKASFIEALRAVCTRLARTQQDVEDIAAIYADRGYDPYHAGIDPITDADVAALGLTGDNIYTGVSTLLNGLVAFYAANSNTARTIMDVLRNDR
jgi:hypothetical protein